MRQLYFGFCISCLYFLHMTNNGFGVMSYSKPRASCIQFADLWKNAETGNPASEYKYQCAIRLSITLHNVGIDMKSFSQKTIKPAPGRQTLGRIVIDGLPVAIRADEMAVWLKQNPFCGLGQAEDITGRNWKDKVYGRTGIIAFSSYWGKKSEWRSY